MLYIVASSTGRKYIKEDSDLQKLRENGSRSGEDRKKKGTGSEQTYNTNLKI